MKASYGLKRLAMPYATALKCRECGREYPLEPVNVCEFCFGPLEVTYDYQRLARDISRDKLARGPRNIWRYRDLLPVGEQVVDTDTGFTTLFHARNLGRALGLEQLYIKNDCINPTYSFKDRVVSVAASRAIEFGFDTLACASTGNLAASVAAHAAKSNMKAYVFIPADLEQGKIVGAAIYNPTLVAVQGNYDEVNRLCSELVDRYEWAFVNVNIRPYYAEGSKTLGYEVAEQLGWRAPDHAVVPVASGSLLSKVWKAFNEFHDLGLIPPVKTRMYAAQALGCSPVVAAFEAGSMHIHPVKPNTIAKSLAIGNPAEGFYALKAMHASGGGGCAVTDDEVVEGMKLLAQTEGIFGETAAGVTIAALKRLAASGRIKADELTVAYVTASGLKTQEAVMDRLPPRLTIQPNVKSFEQALKAQQATQQGK